MSESKFEADFCVWLRRKGCYVIKNNAGSGVPKGTPDRTVLMPGGGWAMLEFKKSAHEKYQVLQKEQLERLKEMWYSASVYPENEAQIKAEIEAML
jgi:Holliday junction resolvase